MWKKIKIKYTVNIYYILPFPAMLIGESLAGPSNTRQSGEGKNLL
jgi:hypothetical protein